MDHSQHVHQHHKGSASITDDSMHHHKHKDVQAANAAEGNMHDKHAGVPYPHFMLSPVMGAVLMSLSTVVVAVNARLLR